MISILSFSKISLSISIFFRIALSISIAIFSKMTISIFFKSVDISTINIRYRYIEQGYLQDTLHTDTLRHLGEKQPGDQNGSTRIFYQLISHIPPSQTQTVSILTHGSQISRGPKNCKKGTQF